ncbi:MAG: sulfur carrier protein ThiS [Bacteroidota bacterium]
MKFILNEQLHETSIHPLSVEEMLGEQGLAQREGIAVAIDQEIVPKSEWSRQHIRENQKVLIITATQGG